MRLVTLLGVCLLWGVIGCSAGEEPVAVSGTELCTEVDRVGDELNRYECVEDLDDERVSGDAVVTVAEVDGSSSPNKMAGTLVIENDGGRWAGDWTGIIEGSGLHVVDGVLVGSGDYEGLQFTGRWEFVDWPATVTGTIESTS